MYLQKWIILFSKAISVASPCPGKTFVSGGNDNNLFLYYLIMFDDFHPVNPNDQYFAEKYIA